MYISLLEESYFFNLSTNIEIIVLIFVFLSNFIVKIYSMLNLMIAVEHQKY